MANHKLIAENESLIKTITDSLGIYDERLKFIHRKKKELSKYLNDIRYYLIVHTGGIDPETHTYIGAREIDFIERYMIGEVDRKGKAYYLKERLNSYCDFINETGIISVSYIANDATDTPLYKTDPDHKHQNFAQLHFENTTLAEAMNTLTYFETAIQEMEKEVLTMHLVKEYKNQKRDF